ncbi:MAG TPA: alpha/beta hydrolase [Candidatus Deferrimicrobium sp.]|nr:alpha/beta hydrolase [Candidatus Kapabacteria bacterium]HLP61307.1 alpha/beta hydrolase [Candidatus Deferrimicrobium sp.]
MISKILRWFAIGLIVTLILVFVIYRWDMKRAYKRVQGKSTIIPSAYGDIEYTENGSGPAVLLIHGSGGGYDQGELFAQALLGNQFHCITPSRFGYLRSTFHKDASWDEQAHAYAFLLDHLHIKKVAVVAISHGGPSALLFGVLHPERVSSITLISCGVVSSTTQNQEQANRKGNRLTTIFKYDLAYWISTKLFKKQFMNLMGVNDAVIAGFTSQQRELVEHFIDYMNPVSLRTKGVHFDNKAVLPGKRIAAIQAPTLIFHAVDDTLQLYHNATFAASTIPGARLMRFESGGHLLMAVQLPVIRTAMQKHILENDDLFRK